MFEASRPLPPLEGRKRTVMKVVIAGYFVVAAAWFVTAALDGSPLRAVFGVIVSFLAAGQLWDFRRRARPERPTAGHRPRAGRRRPSDVRRRASPGRRADRRDRSR